MIIDIIAIATAMATIVLAVFRGARNVDLLCLGGFPTSFRFLIPLGKPLSSMKLFSYCLSRQRMKARAFCLCVRGFTNPPIGKTLSNNAGYRLRHAFYIGRLTGVPFEIPLAETAV
jgi:hypothetical protein